MDAQALKRLSPEQEELINRLVFFQEEFEQPTKDDVERVPVSSNFEFVIFSPSTPKCTQKWIIVGCTCFGCKLLAPGRGSLQVRLLTGFKAFLVTSETLFFGWLFAKRFFYCWFVWNQIRVAWEQVVSWRVSEGCTALDLLGLSQVWCVRLLISLFFFSFWIVAGVLGGSRRWARQVPSHCRADYLDGTADCRVLQALAWVWHAASRGPDNPPEGTDVGFIFDRLSKNIY